MKVKFYMKSGVWVYWKESPPFGSPFLFETESYEHKGVKLYRHPITTNYLGKLFYEGETIHVKGYEKGESVDINGTIYVISRIYKNPDGFTYAVSEYNDVSDDEKSKESAYLEAIIEDTKPQEVSVETVKKKSFWERLVGVGAK